MFPLNLRIRITSASELFNGTQGRTAYGKRNERVHGSLHCPSASTIDDALIRQSLTETADNPRREIEGQVEQDLHYPFVDERGQLVSQLLDSPREHVYSALRPYRQTGAHADQSQQWLPVKSAYYSKNVFKLRQQIKQRDCVACCYNSRLRKQ
jgi:hypothetical protein